MTTQTQCHRRAPRGRKSSGNVIPIWRHRKQGCAAKRVLYYYFVYSSLSCMGTNTKALKPSRVPNIEKYLGGVSFFKHRLFVNPFGALLKGCVDTDSEIFLKIWAVEHKNCSICLVGIKTAFFIIAHWISRDCHFNQALMPGILNTKCVIWVVCNFASVKSQGHL